MKIALVSPYDYPFPGGVTEHIAHLDKEFERLGHEVRILAPSSQDEGELDEHVIKVSGSVVRIPFGGSIARLTIAPPVYPRVKRILKEGQFDIVHLHEPLAPTLPWFVLRHSKSVNIGSFHAYRERWAVFRYGRRLFRRGFNKLHGCIAVSEVVRDSLMNYFPYEYRVIPNGVDVERFGAPDIQPIPEFNDGKLNILFVGRFDKRKGFHHLMQAFPYIKQTVPEARLIVVGPYTRKQKAPFVRYARWRRLRDVKFVGYVPPAKMPRYYKTCHVFCAPSIGFESFGIVLLEAMAAGKPLVTCDIAGYRQVVTPGHEGLLVPPGDEIALARALVSLLRNPTLCQAMGERGRVTAARYAWSAIAQQVLEYYTEVLERERMRRAV